LYKKFSGKGGSGDITKIRVMQYGIDPSNSDHMEKALKLEEKLKDKVNFSGNNASMKVTSSVLLECMTDFGVSVEDEEAVDKWVKWFNERFKPVYLIHRGIMSTINASYGLD